MRTKLSCPEPSRHRGHSAEEVFAAALRIATAAVNDLYVVAHEYRITTPLAARRTERLAQLFAADTIQAIGRWES